MLSPQLSALAVSEVELGGVLQGEFQEDQAPRVFGPGDLRGESRAQTEPRRPAGLPPECSAQQRPVCAQEKPPESRRDHPKGRGARPRGSHRAGNGPLQPPHGNTQRFVRQRVAYTAGFASAAGGEN